MGTDPDQLPLMQHALMRLWELARARAPNAPHLHLDDYDAEGGIKGSLSRHADEIFAEITRDVAERADTARRLFCLLTEGEGESAVRRLAEVAEVIEVTGKPLDEIAAAADPFRALGRSLLMPSLERPLAPDTVLDISHESLIRQWQKLRDWVQVEAASADHYRDNERRAQRWSARTAEFLDGIDLDVALDWRSRERPTAQWAARYGGDFAIAMRFLDESQERRDRLSREAAKERAAAANRLAERLAEAQLHQSRFLTERAREALRDEHLETAKAIAMAALPDDLSAPDRPIWFPAVSVLADARSRDRQRAVLQRLSAAFSPDGARVVTASLDYTARLWDVATGAALAVLQGHTGSVNGAGFSPDGARIVTASGDKTARLWGVWPLLTADTVAYAEIAGLRTLSRDERASLFLIEADTGPGQPQATASTEDPSVGCDLLAGNPFDPLKHGPGVPFDRIDAENAVSACRTAVSAVPSEPRFRYELGRALQRANKTEEAAAAYQAASEKGYPCAKNNLGLLYKAGTGVAKDEAEALVQIRRAADGGCVTAFYSVGVLYWDGIGTGIDHAEALRWFERGADHGDPFSHGRIAELYEIGDQLPQDLEKALFHHAIETRLFEAAGAAPDPAAAWARRGSLARALPPETAVRIAREAAAWRPKGP